MNDPVVNAAEPEALGPRTTRPSSAPPSLIEGDLPDFWADVARRLERNGEGWRGRVQVSSYSPTASRTLTAIIGRPGRKTVDLERLEAELARLGVGDDLPAALAVLGHPVSPEPAARRAERTRVAAGRTAARAEAAAWPEPWAVAWVDELVRYGLLARLGEAEAVAVLGSVRRVLDAIDDRDDGGFSRTDLAATVLGSAHALDDGTLLERATARALVHRQDGSAEVQADPWSALGAHRSLVTGAALTWRLPLDPRHPLAEAVRTSDELRIPFVLTRLAIEAVGLDLLPDRDVLVIENPRVIEHAAQTGSAQPMVCANGNPSTTVVDLVAHLLDAGATVRYHGDFDAAGLEICGRMHARGLTPWNMSAAHYLQALDEADAADVQLPIDANACPTTPWDPDLQAVFDEHRRVVHEERLLGQIVVTGDDR